MSDTSTKILGVLKTHWLPILLVVLAAVFIAENRYSTTIELFWLKVTAPLWLILLAVFVVGFVAGRLSGRRGAARKK